MGLFWLFLFRFRNNRISISKRTLLHVSDLKTESEVTWKLLYLRTDALECQRSCQRTWRPRRISRQKCPKRTRILSIPSKPHSFHSVHSAIGSRMNGMIFHSFRKRNSSQKNTNTVYSEYSYSGIVPKERALNIAKVVILTELAGFVKIAALFGTLLSSSFALTLAFGEISSNLPNSLKY